MIRSFRDLQVWQKAMEVAMEVLTLTKRFPAEEKYSLTDQIRRSSRSVPANIAEAWRKRRYSAAFVAKLNDAEAEAAETQTHLEIALRCGYLDKETAFSLDSIYNEILAMLDVMAANPEQWTRK
jgi:four helix bundle protein